MKERLLANNLGCSVEEAVELMNRYMDRYPAVKKFYAEAIEETRQTGYAFSLLGRRRFLPEIVALGEYDRFRAERQAVNMQIQGSAADAAKMAMILIDEADLESRFGCKMLLQVHTSSGAAPGNRPGSSSHSTEPLATIFGMGIAPNLIHEDLPRAKPLKRRAPKTCLRCERRFVPTGQNQKRCAACGPQHQLEANLNRWHRNYVKRGYNQAKENNNNWRGGKAPSTYREICFAAHGNMCFECGRHAVLAHHLDGNRSNNTIENLRPMCKRCHQLEHDCTGNLPKPGSLKPKPCVDCGEDFKPGSGRALRCSSCRGLHLRQIAREKGRRRRSGSVSLCARANGARLERSRRPGASLHHGP